MSSRLKIAPLLAAVFLGCTIASAQGTAATPKFQRLQFREGVFRGYCDPSGIAYWTGFLFIADASRPRLLVSRASRPGTVIQEIDLRRDFGKSGVKDIAYAAKLEQFFALLEGEDSAPPVLATFRLRTTGDGGFRIVPRTTSTVSLKYYRNSDVDDLQLTADERFPLLSIFDPARHEVAVFRLGGRAIDLFDTLRRDQPQPAQILAFAGLDLQALADDDRNYVGIRRRGERQGQQLIRIVTENPKAPDLIAQLPRELSAEGVAVSRTTFYVVARNPRERGQAAIVGIERVILIPSKP